MSKPPSVPLGRAAVVVVGVVGAVVGFFSALQVTRMVSLGAVHISVGAVVAFVANAGLGFLAAWALRSRDAALAPGIGWFIVVLAMLFLPRPGGDIIVPEAGGDAIAFLVLGFFGIFVAGFAAARIVPRRGATPPVGSRR